MQVPRKINYRDAAVFVLVVLSISVVSYTQLLPPPTRPWEKKDWRDWTREECEIVLSRSPWAKSRSQFFSSIHYADPGSSIAYTAQIRSALPIRHALIREEQLRKRYDKMNSSQKAEFDRKMELKYGELSKDRIVVRIVFYWSGGFTDESRNNPPARVRFGKTAVLILSNGRTVSATQCRKIGEDLEAEFPRVLNGEPVIRSDDKLVIFTTGDMVKSKFRQTSSEFIFSLENMVYKGQREF
jgi:hypothetical protein